MGTQEAWGHAKLDGGPNAVSSYCQRFGIYIFLISFACVYYLSNAPLLLGHYDLGWHLAAGDLIRDSRQHSFPGSMVIYPGDRQWYNLSWLWDVIASVLFQYTKFSGLILFVVACGAIIVGYLTSICSKQRSLGNRSLHFRFFGVSALPLFCDGAEYLSRRFAEHFHHVVLRHFLRRMSEKKAMVFVACDHGSFGSICMAAFCLVFLLSAFFAAWLCSDGIGQTSDLHVRGSRLLYCNIYQSSWLAYL